MKRILTTILLTLSVAAPAAEYDYGLVARKIAKDVYAFVGRTEDFTMANGGNIVNSGFIVAAEGVVVIDTGSSLRYGQQMRSAMEAIAGGKPIALTINTHHHPDHFLGNQAFADAPIGALPGTRQGIAADGNAFAENLFRLTGEWMKGTEVVAPTRSLDSGTIEIAGRKLRLIGLGGHTGADLAVYDETTGTLFAGDLVFNGRAPTTPHADVAEWLIALEKLEAVTREAGFSALVPGHGEISGDAAPIRQTRAWLMWLQNRMRESARAGLDMNEVLARPLPPEFADLPVAASEYRRSVGHLFPAAEQEALSNATLH